MDFGFFGIMDLVVILIIIASIIIGYKIGLMRSLLKWMKRLSGLIAGIMFSAPLGNFINKHFLNEGKIHDYFYNNVSNKVNGILTNESTLDQVIDSLGFPTFVDNYIKAGILNYDTTTIINDITSRLTYVIGVIIAFIILTIGVYIAYLILLLVINALKESIKLIDIIDRVFGAAIWGILGLIFTFIVLLIVTQVAKIDSLESYREFINKDMCLLTDEWRLSKYINDHNFVRTIFSLLFG